MTNHNQKLGKWDRNRQPEVENHPVALDQLAQNHFQRQAIRVELTDLEITSQSFKRPQHIYPLYYQEMCGGSRNHYEARQQQLVAEDRKLRSAWYRLVTASLASDQPRPADLDIFIKTYLHHQRLDDKYLTCLERQAGGDIIPGTKAHLPELPSPEDNDYYQTLRSVVAEAEADWQGILDQVGTGVAIIAPPQISPAYESTAPPTLFEIGSGHRDISRTNQLVHQIRKRVETRTSSYNRFEPATLAHARQLAFAIDREIVARYDWRDLIRRAVIADQTASSEVVDFVRTYHAWCLNTPHHRNTNSFEFIFNYESGPESKYRANQLKDQPWLSPLVEIIASEHPTLF